jgi:hypothetical protein
MRRFERRRANGQPIIVFESEVSQIPNCTDFMRPEPKAASKPPFDYGNSATAQSCFYKQAGFSLRQRSAGIFLS